MGFLAKHCKKLNMKKVFLLLILFVTHSVYSQNIPNIPSNVNIESISDVELLKLWEDAKKEGYSLDQLKTLARAQGASEMDISKFTKRINALQTVSEDTKENDGAIEKTLTSMFGIIPEKEEQNQLTSEEAKLPIFGMDFFESQSENLNFSNSPQLNLATPSSYQLGPGDELEILVWGASENTYLSTINASGYIKIDRVAPIYLSGFTVSGAKNRVKKALSKIYSGISGADESFTKVFFDLNLVKSRSIIVNMVGSIKNPGTYTLPSVSSPLNALYAAGGPTENGSFRNIKIFRNNRFYKSIDLYEYFINGTSPNITLRDQDVIVVPKYENRAFVNGEFKETGIFEFKTNETIHDLILFTGGFSPFGFDKKVFIESVSGINKETQSVSDDLFSSTNINDGDIIMASAISGNFNNKVTIEGSVNLPGNYSITESPDLKSLIISARGLSIDALKTRAIVYRTNDGIENGMLSVNLNDILNDKTEFLFKNNDRVQVFSKKNVLDVKTVEIKGEVNSPGIFDFYEGMTVLDLILMSEGVKRTGSFVSIDLYRETLDIDGTPFKSISVDLNSEYGTYNMENNPSLNENDMVIVRIKEGYSLPEFAQIQGLVRSPGFYSILSNKYSLYDLLEDSGGILPDGSVSGVKIRRVNRTKKEIDEALENFASDSSSIEIKKQLEYIEFGIDVEKLLESKGGDFKYNVILKNGDIVSVPKADNTIEVIGEVEQPTVVNYKKGLSTSDAINQAGGFTEVAKKRGVFVVYQNGTISSNKKFFIFNTMPKLKPGSKIVVPKRVPNPNKTSLTELVGLTSTLATLVVLIRSL